ncbi:YlbF family regulator [Alicyclobacillus fastidiosus]|uniref:YlbF family regulator n=1 Tax=Alicyclobacillus fastidiosus TaxID=392011 RepID=A0ABV5AIF0_9BACL|nr:YlbF family regulator [Alicyclobacillus fastidiosus]WEH08143.1 YlbF family regulator [Alicyclobacillus fastidiosus]
MDRVDLIVQADELAKLILHRPEIRVYRAAEAALEANGEAMNLWRRLRELREQVAEFQARRVPPMHYSYLLAETDQLLDKLNAMPEVQAYEEAQTKLNELLDAISSRLSSAVEQRNTE